MNSKLYKHKEIYAKRGKNALPVREQVWMIPDFLAMEARRKWHSIFQCWKKIYQLILCLVRISCRNEDMFISKKTKRLCYQQAYLEKMAKGSSSNRKEVMKEGHLEHEGRKNNRKSKTWGDKKTILLNFLNLKNF